MAVLLNNVVTTDKTSDNEISTPNAVGLSILIANAAVIANFKQVPREGAGNSNEMPWGPDLLLAPQTAQYRNVSGFRCRSAVSGVPARVVAVLSEKSDPQALGATPYTAVLSAGGGVTPGANSVEVDHNGAVIGTEPKLDFEDTAGDVLWTLTDDVANQRVKVSASQSRCGWNLTRAANQTLASGAKVEIQFDTTLEDTHGFRTGAFVTIPAGQGGVYIFGHTWEWSGNANGNDQHWIDGAASTYAHSAVFGGGDVRDGQIFQSSPLAAGDTLTCFGLHVAAGTLDIVAVNFYSPRFWGVKITP